MKWASTVATSYRTTSRLVVASKYKFRSMYVGQQGVETGDYPHTTVCDDISANQDAIDLLMDRFGGDLDIIFLESGGIALPPV